MKGRRPTMASPSVSLMTRLRRVRALVLDFDGVLTDNTVFVHEDGSESVRCWRGDGIGLAALRGIGVSVFILSTEVNPVVSARARKLDIPVVQGCEDKGRCLDAILAEHGLSAEEVAYVGNDTNDLPCLRSVGVPIVVADAHPDTEAHALYRTAAAGGRGAVREVCDLLVAARTGQIENNGKPEEAHRGDLA